MPEGFFGVLCLDWSVGGGGSLSVAGIRVRWKGGQHGSKEGVILKRGEFGLIV